MKEKVEKVLSDILSRKHDAKITIKLKEKKNGGDKNRTIKEK